MPRGSTRLKLLCRFRMRRPFRTRVAREREWGGNEGEGEEGFFSLLSGKQ